MDNRIFISKLWLVSLCSLIIFGNCSTSTTAQDNGTAASIKNMIDAKHFTFIAESVSPLRGSNRTLTTGYEVEVSKDSFSSYLPYFGRGTNAAIGKDGGIKFTSTQFSYEVTQSKTNRWDIDIKPVDIPDVQQFSFTVFSNGTASLNINSNTRDPISFSGTIKH